MKEFDYISQCIFFQQVLLVNKAIAPRIASRWISISSVQNADMVDQEDRSVPIPIYKQKENETLELQKAR